MKVIDASVAVKWLREEAGSAKAQLLYDNHLDGKEGIIVPEFFFIEIANFLATQPSVTQDDVSSSFSIISNASFSMHVITQEDIVETTHLAKQYHTSVYDMLYLVVAEQSHAELISADEKFVSKVGKAFPFVTLLGDIQ